jgi:hypothetical protein
VKVIALLAVLSIHYKILAVLLAQRDALSALNLSVTVANLDITSLRMTASFALNIAHHVVMVRDAWVVIMI